MDTQDILYNWYFLQAFNFRTPHGSAKITFSSNRYQHSNTYIVWVLEFANLKQHKYPSAGLLCEIFSTPNQSCMYSNCEVVYVREFPKIKVAYTLCISVLSVLPYSYGSGFSVSKVPNLPVKGAIWIQDTWK